MLYVSLSNEQFGGLRLRSGDRTEESIYINAIHISDGSGSGIIFGTSSAHGCKKLTAELDFCVQPRIDFILNYICVFPHLPSVLGSRLAPDLSISLVSKIPASLAKASDPRAVKI